MRVKGGVVTRRRHKRMLKQAEGFRGRRSTCFKLAKRSVQKALQYAYRDRHSRKAEFRALWITRINAAARLCGTTYRELIHGLKVGNVDMNRKMLAELAAQDMVAFEALVKKVAL